MYKKLLWRNPASRSIMRFLIVVRGVSSSALLGLKWNTTGNMCRTWRQWWEVTPLRALLLIFLAVSVCIIVRRNELAMRIWLVLRILLPRFAVRTSFSNTTVFNVLLSVVSLSNSFNRIPNNFFYELLATEERRQTNLRNIVSHRQRRLVLSLSWHHIGSFDRLMLLHVYHTTRYWNQKDFCVRTSLKAFYE
jgi:hypothetical protein